MSGDVEATLVQYRETLVRWGEASEADAITAANSLFDESHRLFKLLRDHAAGRGGITELMDDSNPWVRSAAAAHSLLWAPERALAMLEMLERDTSAPPEVRISAEYTAIEWRAGRLSFDW